MGDVSISLLEVDTDVVAEGTTYGQDEVGAGAVRALAVEVGNRLLGLVGIAHSAEEVA